MCLNQVIDFKTQRTTGYKWFNYSKIYKKYYTPLNYTCNTYRLGKWYKNKHKTTLDNEYSSGFHICLLKKDALKSFMGRNHRTLVKVKFRDYITGYGDGSTGGEEYKQIVAQEIMLVKVIKKGK